MSLLCSQSSFSPCHRLSTLPALRLPFLFPPNSIPPRTSLAVVPTQNQGLFPTTKLQLRDSLPSATASEKLDALKTFQDNGGTSTISEFNNLLMCLVSADEFELALKLKSSLSSSSGLFPDNRTYSIFVNCYCKKNEPTEARSVLDQMLEEGFQPNAATFTTLINSFCKIGRVRNAYEVFDIMSRIGCEPTINTYNCLLKGLCYVGRVEEAYELMERIKKSPMKPDIYTYTAMMDGFCKVGRSTEASELLNEALEMKLTPTVVTYNTLFNSFFKEGKPLSGFGVLRQMRERNCKPDYICYSTFLHGVLKWGKIRSALQIYKEMVGAGLQADERMMNTLLRGLCRQSREEKGLLKDVYRVYEDMRNGKYTICGEAYNLVVEAFWSGGNMDRVCEVMEEMVRLGHSPKTFTFNIAIRGLCSVGEIDKALGVLVLVHKNRKPNGIPFNLLIDKLNQRKRSVEASIVYAVALKRGVVPNRKPRKVRKYDKPFN